MNSILLNQNRHFMCLKLVNCTEVVRIGARHRTANFNSHSNKTECQKHRLNADIKTNIISVCMLETVFVLTKIKAVSFSVSKAQSNSLVVDQYCMVALANISLASTKPTMAPRLMESPKSKSTIIKASCSKQCHRQTSASTLKRKHPAITFAKRQQQNRNCAPITISIPTPTEYLESLFESAGNVNAESKINNLQEKQSAFQSPTQHDIDSYDLQAVKAIRSRNLEELRCLYKAGKSMKACNKFGESLMHLVCRRGDIEIVEFMVHEANVSCNMKDDYGRLPIHDALWTAKPNFEVVDLLMNASSPHLWLSKDVRGATPFDYTRKEHHRSWLKFLQSRKETIIQRIKDSSLPSSETINVPPKATSIFVKIEHGTATPKRTVG